MRQRFSAESVCRVSSAEARASYEAGIGAWDASGVAAGSAGPAGTKKSRKPPAGKCSAFCLRSGPAWRHPGGSHGEQGSKMHPLFVDANLICSVIMNCFPVGDT